MDIYSDSDFHCDSKESISLQDSQNLVSQLVDNFSLVNIGRRGSNKRFFHKYLINNLFHFGKIDDLIIVSRFAKKYGTYTDFTIGRIYNEYDDDISDKLINLQKERIAKGENKKVLILFDMCIQKSIYKYKYLEDLLKNHKSYNISYIFAEQYLCNFSTCATIDYFLLHGDDFKSNTRRTYDKCIPKSISYEIFHNIISKINCYTPALLADGKNNLNYFEAKECEFNNKINLLELHGIPEDEKPTMFDFETLKNKQSLVANTYDIDTMSIADSIVTSSNFIKATDNMNNISTMPVADDVGNSKYVNKFALIETILKMNQSILDMNRSIFDNIKN
jgi:hypothetical protein